MEAIERLGANGPAMPVPGSAGGDTSVHFLELFQKFDAMEKAILSAGVSAVAHNRITMERFMQWSSALIDRHRAGGTVLVSELNPEGV